MCTRGGLKRLRDVAAASQGLEEREGSLRAARACSSRPSSVAGSNPPTSTHHWWTSSSIASTLRAGRRSFWIRKSSSERRRKHSTDVKIWREEAEGQRHVRGRAEFRDHSRRRGQRQACLADNNSLRICAQGAGCLGKFGKDTFVEQGESHFSTRHAPGSSWRAVRP